MKRFMKKPISALFAFGLIFGWGLLGCGDGSSGGEEDDNIIRDIFYSSTTTQPGYQGEESIFSYRYGLKSWLDISDEKITEEYNKWCDAYLTSEGAGGFLRIKRDDPSYNDTVSEGIAYGMLISMYCGDMDTFDKLYGYAKLHFIDTTDGRYLMHWKVSKDGTDISEFRCKVTNDPQDHAFCYLITKDKDGHELWNTDEDEKRVYIAGRSDASLKALYPQYPKENWLSACENTRQRSSATDADLDMAAALVIASYKSSDNAQYYRTEAAKMIKAIIEYDCTDNLNGSPRPWFIKNGSQWGGFDEKKCWNPSYFAPSWFKLYAKFLKDYKDDNSVRPYLMDESTGTHATSADKAINIINQIITNVYEQFKNMGDNNNVMGLPPDWCTSIPGDNIIYPGTESDRLYYYDENRDGKMDDLNSDGKITEKDASRQMSFNFYYDAVRVPWRLALDYSWYGDTRAYDKLFDMMSFFKRKGDNLVDGYTPYGNAWERDYRDGFNNLIPGKDIANDPVNGVVGGKDGGQWKNSVTFNAFCATAFAVCTQNKNAAITWGAKVLNTTNYGEKFNYYGNTARMLSLLFVSGRFTCPYVKVSIRSNATNKYVSANSNMMGPPQLYANASSIRGNAQLFDIVAGMGTDVKLKSYSDIMMAKCTKIDSPTAIYLYEDNTPKVLRLRMENSDGKVAFLWNTISGSRYLSADTAISDKAPLCTNRSSIDQTTLFTIEPQQ